MATQSYERINWEDADSTATPLNADNLNHMEDGIAAATQGVQNVETDKEDKSNKAARITSSNIGSGTSYPSIAAVAQYLGANYYDKSDIDDSTYTKAEVNTALAAKANTADVNTALAAKANTADVNTALAAKADKATTLSGYGITDAYTKDEIKAMIATAAPVKTWGDVQSVVRLGLAPDRFPVGFEFEVERGNEIITFVVRGHNTIQPQSSQLTHSMILEAKNICFKAQHDAPEALVYIGDENGLSTNTDYWIPWDSSSGLSGQYLKFKTPSTPTIGQGYQIVLNTSTSPATLDVYQRRTDTTPVISGIAVTATNNVSGTVLGTGSNPNSVNSPARAVKGSNNYSQSAVRQLLYKNAAAGAVWNQTNKFDRPPAWAQTLSGFMYGLNADFVGVLSKAKIICITNNVYETTNNSGDPFTSPYEVNNEFFILSRAEVMGTGSDGTQLEGYVNATNAQRIKYDSTGTASTCVLRTPDTDSANALWYIKTDGSVGKGNPQTAFGVCPACIIA